MKNTIIMVNYLVPLLLIFCFNYVRCETDNCNFGTCGECISYGLERCVWCSQDKFNDRRCRPLSYGNSNNTWCKNGSLVDPPPTSEVISSNENFGEMSKGGGGFKVQFKPELIKIKARPGIKMPFEMLFKPAQDFPLDVYYLMDISDTMKRRIADLKDQALEIYRDLSAYTNNVRLGIGSFVEKPGFPYFDPNKHKSHAFKNDVPLTHDMGLFTSTIANITFGSNFDDPEAGLDALMQAMTCIDAVGWRPGARRIIVLCTDSTYHSAGDGKIVGAIKPHDMRCHLENNIYSEALTYDYPSISQINQAATDGNFRIIFAITKNHHTGKSPEDEYRELANQIVGAKYAKLEGGKSVIKIIKEAYEELASTVKLTFQAPSFVEVNIDQDCESEHKRNCESPHKQIVNITGTLKVTSCPPNDARKKTHNVTVNPIGLPDKLIIELDVNCECDCEKQIGVPTRECHGSGYLRCGICKCDPGRHGAKCQCDGSSTDWTDMQKCKLNADDAKLCSGRGKCRCYKCQQYGYAAKTCRQLKSTCGHCGEEGHSISECAKKTDTPKCATCSRFRNPNNHKTGDAECPARKIAEYRCGKCESCQKGFSGDFCEFDDNSCPRPKNILCSGHGRCQRAQCQCDSHWIESDCSCPDHNKDCYAPYSKEVCSGQGKCVCGQCQCDKIKGKNESYSGAFCDSCEECAERRCKELENYAYCNYMHQNDKAFCDQENNGTTKGIDVFFVNKTEINDQKLYMAKWCMKELDSHNGSYMVFKYQYEKNDLKITIQKELEIPPKANIWIAAGSAIGLVLLIGILTVIIWKILVDIHDKKEYEKFSSEALAQGYDVSQNPLYQDPSINFSNPVYNNQCTC